MRGLDIITDSIHVNLSKPRETVEDREAWPAAVRGSQRVRHNGATEQQRSWSVDPAHTVENAWTYLLYVRTKGKQANAPLSVVSWGLRE